MEHYLIPIIQKKPRNIILHVGTNDAKNLPSRTILDNLLKLKVLVKESFPRCRVFISTPTLRIRVGLRDGRKCPLPPHPLFFTEQKLRTSKKNTKTEHK